MTRVLISISLVALAIAATVVGILGFQGKLSRKPPLELFPDMDRQARLRPQEPSRFFTNGISSQLPPPGTIPRSAPVRSLAGDVYAFEDSPVNSGRIASTTNFAEVNPLPVTEDFLKYGRQRFDIYCAPCHGRLGDGNGITKKIGVMAAVANLHDSRVVLMPDGEVFDVITHGRNTMGALAPMMNAHDRWAVVAYLRALQLSRLGSRDDLSPEQQERLK